MSEKANKKMSFEQIQRRIDYLDGYLAALYNYAWWRNGELLLGCGIKTYKEVAEQIKRELSELGDMFDTTKEIEK